jgi:hypothetical protein
MRRNPANGLLMFADLMLLANLRDSGPNHFTNKSISSKGVTFNSLMMCVNVVFHVSKESG